jgi:hypothetical protein
MTDEPAKIWAWVWNTPGIREHKKNSWCDFKPVFKDWVTRGLPTKSNWGGKPTVHNQTVTEYTRSDIAEAEVARLKAALCFYAEKAFWHDGGIDFSSYENCADLVLSTIEADNGKTARAALAHGEAE